MKVFFFALLFFLLSFVAQAQQKGENLAKEKYRIFYKLTCLKDSTDSASVHSEPMLLQVGEGISKFMSYRNYLQDSTLIASGQQDMSIPHTQFYFSLYKNHPKGKITFRDQTVALINLEYEVKNEPLRWEILPEQRQVAGYNCQKATTHFAGRDYVAWFTTEIHLLDAPYKFDGLPGFILKVQDTRAHFTFDFQRIVKTQHIPEHFIFTRKRFRCQKVTREEFLKKQKSVQHRSLEELLAGQGLTIHFDSEETTKNVQKNIRAFSNYIELE